MSQSIRIALLGVVILLVQCLGVSNMASAQSISGVVNQYAKVTYITPPSLNSPIVVINNPVFAANDKVMIIQMKGATIDTSNSANFGTINALNAAGLYEFGIVNYVSGDTVILKGPICNSYNVNDSVQLIKVAVYSSPVTVTGTLTCAPWANGVGGVLVVDAADVLTLNADVDVSFKGFRGGNVFGVSFSCGSTDYCIPNNGLSSSDGLKGEGVAQYVPGKESGRAASANGGGGAGAGNAAAGGGGNYGAGGNGGAQWSGCGAQATNALYFCKGGNLLSTSANRLFLGGGGGGPQHDNGYPVFNGGNGGGIILIRAKSINGNTFAIRSNGDSILQTHDEGTSGGGAGGTIYLECPTYTTNVTLEAKGGKGGSVYNTLYPNYCHSPGGGGGGGTVWFSTGSVPPVATVNVSGGTSGLVLNPASPCYNTADFATDGGAGGVLFSLPDPFFYPAQYTKDTVACIHTPINLSVDSGYQSYLWSTGATTYNVNVNKTGIYIVQATTNLGCIVLDTLTVKYDSFSLGPDTTLCFGNTIVLTPVPANDIVTYKWQDFSTTPTYTVTQPGIYRVEVRTVHNCLLADTVNIKYYPQIYSHIDGNSNACPGTTITLSSLESFPVYNWSTGETTRSINVGPGGYVLQVTTSNGCIAFDTAIVGQFPTPMPYIGMDTAVCFNLYDTVMLTPGAFKRYFWQDSSYANHYVVTRPGYYSVTVTDTNGCRANVNRLISNEACPNPFFVPTAFSPNKDGLNDVFKLKVLDPDALKSFELSVFDRWGERVFHTFNVNDGWDGNFKNKPAEIGSYFWSVTFSILTPKTLQPQALKMTGDVTLIR